MAIKIYLTYANKRWWRQDSDLFLLTAAYRKLTLLLSSKVVYLFTITPQISFWRLTGSVHVN